MVNVQRTISALSIPLIVLIILEITRFIISFIPVVGCCGIIFPFLKFIIGVWAGIEIVKKGGSMMDGAIGGAMLSIVVVVFSLIYFLAGSVFSLALSNSTSSTAISMGVGFLSLIIAIVINAIILIVGSVIGVILGPNIK